MILGISGAELMALTDDELEARRLDLGAQERGLAARRDLAARRALADDPGHAIRVRDAYVHTVGSLHAAKREWKRRRELLRDGADSLILDVVWKWGHASRAWDAHEDECGCDPCEVCDTLGETLAEAEVLLHAALDAKWDIVRERDPMALVS